MRKRSLKRVCFAALESNAGGGVIDEQIRIADVAPNHGDGDVPRQRHDGALGFAGFGGGGAQAGAQAVAGVIGGVETSSESGIFDDACNVEAP